MKAVSFDNDVKVRLKTDDDDHFLGLGRVTVGKAKLRAGRRPMFAHIRTPDAVELCDYKLEDRSVNDDAALLKFSARQRNAYLMEWMCHEVRNRVNTGDWTAAPEPAEDTTLSIELRPVTRSVGGVELTGFSYQYRYASEDLPIYKIVDRGTWEPGGKAVGNELWLRNNFVRPIFRFESTDDRYCTEWYMPSIAQPNIFQFVPFQTELSGFTFTTSKTGTVITWATEVAHIRSLFEKARGADEIVHWHEHCGDLSHAFHTAPVEVLFAPGKLNYVERANLYEAMRELVFDTLHAEIGMRQERVTSYGMIEEWTDADLEDYRTRGLPKLLDAGIKKIGLANHFQNNMNTFGVSNMCCTVDYKVAETVGEDRLRAFCDDAQAGDAKTEMWGNTSVSALTLLLGRRNGEPKRVDYLPREGSILEAIRSAQRPWVRNPSGAIEADHYTPAFLVMNLRDPVVRDYWMERWRYAHDEVGLEGIFLDSSFNLSSDKFHYQPNPAPGRHGATADQIKLLGYQRPDREPEAIILSQYRAHLDLIVEMQNAGYDYCTEDIGVFGIHRHGPGAAAMSQTLPLWNECLADLDVPGLEEAGADPDDVFFRGLAYRLMWKLTWDPKTDQVSFHHGGVRNERDLPGDWHVALYRAFNEVGELMYHRRILPDEQGVIYEHNGQRVLWAFEDFELPLDEPTRVRDVLGDATETADQIDAERHHVYVIG